MDFLNNEEIAGNPLKAMLDPGNMERAIEQVRKNKGKAGIDGMDVYQMEEYMEKHMASICALIRERKYEPQPVRRVYIPKDNHEKRPLGIPTVVDRVVQQALAQVLYQIFDPYFSQSSFGYRHGTGAQQAVLQACEYINEGYEWIVDLDISKFFDTVNQDKLISLVRKRMNDATLLHLIRKFMKAGIMENGLVSPSDLGLPQGGNLSPVLSLIYLDELDKELGKRNLKFCRYADDFVVFVRSEKAANRVLESITRWIEKHLFLKVNATKSRVVRPNQAKFLGCTFHRDRKSQKWVPNPHKESRKKLKGNIRKVTSRRFANARPLGDMVEKLNQKVNGWINYYSICPCMKNFLIRIASWMRHRVRTWMLKQWKRRSTIFENLKKMRNLIQKLNASPKTKKKIHVGKNITDGYLFAQCFTRCGWNRLGNNHVVHSLLPSRLLHSPIFTKGDRSFSLTDPLKIYFRSVKKFYPVS